MMKYMVGFCMGVLVMLYMGLGTTIQKIENRGLEKTMTDLWKGKPGK